MKGNKMLENAKPIFASAYKNILHFIACSKNSSFAEFLKCHFTEIIFGTYIFAVTAANGFVEIATANRGKIGILLYSLVILFAFSFAIPKIKVAICNLSFQKKKDFSFEQNLKIFSLFFFGIFCVMFFLFRAYNPGGFSPDSISQYAQATRGKYDDWHPAWHTLVFFTLPLKMTGSVSSICLFQMFVFSILCGYIALVIYKYANIYFAVGSAALIALNPFTLFIILYPWKDVGFALAAGFCTVFSAQIYFTKGEWCRRKRRILIFAFFLASATIFRHNAILFTFPMLISLLFFMPKKRWILLCSVCFALFFAIKIPLYSHLKVSKPGGRTTETMGLPVSVICFAAQKCPEKLDLETLEFVWDLCRNDPNVLARYNIAGYNSIKWNGSDSGAIERVGKKKMILMMIKCFVRAPKESLIGFFGLTRCVWSFEYTISGGVGITSNNLNIAYHGSEKMRKIAEDCIALLNRSFFKYASSIGLSILVMLAFILFKSNFKYWSDWKRIFLCIPIFTYNFGTMLLLTGHDVRFFYVSFLVCPLVILILCGKQTEAEQ